jgi:hypothetical protein
MKRYVVAKAKCPGKLIRMGLNEATRVMAEIQLNFLAADPEKFEFQICRQPYDQSKIMASDLHKYKLPSTDGTYQDYLVSFSEVTRSRLLN